MIATALPWILLLASAQAPAKFPIESLTFTGSVYPREGWARITGLAVGKMAGDSDFQKACDTLVESGFAQTASYQFGPGPARKGYAVTIAIEDAPAQAARIDLPGIEENEAWRELEKADPLLIRRVPDNPKGQARYAAALEGILRARGQAAAGVEARLLQVVLGVGDPILLFEPRNLTRVTAVDFTGVKVASSERLKGSMAPAIGSGFTQRRFRDLLELNARPVLDREGLLRASFAKVELNPAVGPVAAVTVTVDEGRVWTLGKVILSGGALPEAEMLKAAGFPMGKTANWSAIEQSLAEMERPLRSRGHLAVRTEAKRVFREDAGAVDLEVSVVPGAVYRFGSVRFTGLSASEQAAARRLWKLAEGTPFDSYYPAAFLRQLAGGGPFPFRGVSQNQQMTPDNQVELEFAFKR